MFNKLDALLGQRNWGHYTKPTVRRVGSNPDTFLEESGILYVSAEKSLEDWLRRL